MGWGHKGGGRKTADDERKKRRTFREEANNGLLWGRREEEDISRAALMQSAKAQRLACVREMREMTKLKLAPARIGCCAWEVGASI